MNLSVTEVTSSNSLISQIMITLMFLLLFKLLEHLFDSPTWFFVVVVFGVFFLHQKTSLRYSVVSLKNKYLPRQRSRCSNGNFNKSEWYHKFVSRWYLKAKRFGDVWCCHISDTECRIWAEAPACSVRIVWRCNAGGTRSLGLTCSR